MSTRRTSVDVYHRIESEGLLSKRRFEVYEVLYKHGPLTATQIADKLPFTKSSSVGANVHARLGELRNAAVVQEMGETECPVTGNTVISWDTTNNLPVKYEKPNRIKCGQCKGRGYVVETQAKLIDV